MDLTSLCRRRNSSRARRAGPARFTRGRRLRLEPLEDRTLLAVFNVSPAVPDGDPGSLRNAISQANANAGEDHIYLEAGTYTLSIVGDDDTNAAGDLDVTDTSGVLNIMGAGQDTTTIDAAGIDRVLHVLGGASLNVSGLTITGGRGGTYSGAGIFVENDYNDTNVHSYLSVNQCTISGNSGTGIYQIDQSATGNVTASITDCTISGNWTYAERLWGGGGIASLSGRITISNSTISDNASYGGPGGGIGSAITDLYVLNCTICGNVADTCSGGGYTGNGGGVFVHSGSNYGVLEIANSTISGNRVGWQGSGSGLKVQGEGEVTITNTTITGNQTDDYSYGGAVVITTAAGVSIQNTIVADNDNPPGRWDWCSQSNFLSSLGNNLIGSANPESGFIDGVNGDQVGTVEAPLDAVLGPLQDNGGPTWTHALLPGSPAIDAGTNVGAPTADQRGIARPQDGDNDENFIVDIGAYELIPPAPTPEGSNVSVQPADTNSDTTPVTLTFESVDTAGDTSLAKGDEGPDPPQGFMLGDPATYYDIETTAGYSGTITICIDYSDVSYHNENQLKVFHYEDTDDNGEPDTWVDCTDWIDKDNDLIYAQVTSLSPFAVFEQYEIVGIEVNPDSVNLVSNGVIGVTVFTTEQFNAAAIDVASVVFAEAYAVQSGLEDADGDGDLDMVLHFRLDETNLRQVYEALVADDLDGDGVLDSSRKEVEVSLTGETVADELFMGLDEVDLFLRGKALRELLDELAAEGAI